MGGDMGMIGGSSGGFIDGLKQSLSFLPNWAAILIIALGVILSAMLVGWIFGKIIGSILYPDPDKQSILTKQQKFIALGGATQTQGGRYPTRRWRGVYRQYEGYGGWRPANPDSRS